MMARIFAWTISAQKTIIISAIEQNQQLFDSSVLELSCRHGPKATAVSRVPVNMSRGPEMPGKDTYGVQAYGQMTCASGTILGEYVEVGRNHGRKVYKKNCPSNSEFAAINVMLYYRDFRDGPELEGWWIGHNLGGTQVWAHNKCSATKPPTTGWKQPRTGDVLNNLKVTEATLQRRRRNDGQDQGQRVKGKFDFAQSSIGARSKRYAAREDILQQKNQR